MLEIAILTRTRLTVKEIIQEMRRKKIPFKNNSIYGNGTASKKIVNILTKIKINDDLIQKIQQSIRAACSPRHVPEIILEAKDIPYTINGKKVEIAVKKVINGENVENKDALKNPEALDLFKNIRQLKL